jgi:hypothetical protein
MVKPGLPDLMPGYVDEIGRVPGACRYAFESSAKRKAAPYPGVATTERDWWQCKNALPGMASQKAPAQRFPAGPTKGLSVDEGVEKSTASTYFQGTIFSVELTKKLLYCSY